MSKGRSKVDSANAYEHLLCADASPGLHPGDPGPAPASAPSSCPCGFHEAMLAVVEPMGSVVRQPGV